MTALVLKHANKSSPGKMTIWGPDDFDVCVSDRCIGRIFQQPQAPAGPQLDVGDHCTDYPRTIEHSRGYSETREQAMADFKAQWRS